MAPEADTATTSVRLMSLADIIARAPEDQEPAPGFPADLHGEKVEVTAVLQRTVVVAPLRDRWADKQPVLHANLLVDPAALRWRPKPLAQGAWRLLAHVKRQASGGRIAGGRDRARSPSIARARFRRRALVPPIDPSPDDGNDAA